MVNSTDLQILKLLGGEKRISNTDIASRLDIAESTVRQRIKRMEKSGILRFSAQVNTNVFPDTYIVIVGIDLNVLTDEFLKEFIKLPNVVFTLTVTGKYDILAAIVANSREMLSETIERTLYGIPGVTNTETFLVLRNFGLFINAETFTSMIEKSDEMKKTF